MENRDLVGLIKPMLVSDAIAKFETEKIVLGKLTKKTQYDYKMHLRLFKEYLPPGICLHEITKEIIVKYLGIAGQGRDKIDRKGRVVIKAKPSVYMPVSALRIIKVFLNWCADDDQQFLLRVPISKKFKLGKPDDKIRPIPSEENLRLLLRYFEGDSFLQRRNYALVLFMVNTGCRRSEILADPRNDRTGVRIQDLRLAEGECTVFGKGRKQRVVGFEEPTAKALVLYDQAVRKRFRVQKTLAYWLTEEGTPLQGESFRKTLKKTCKLIGIEYFPPHAYRWGYCTNLAENNINSELGMLLSGHDTYSMYHKYGKPTRVKIALEEQRKHSPVAGL